MGNIISKWESDWNISGMQQESFQLSESVLREDVLGCSVIKKHTIGRKFNEFAFMKVIQNLGYSFCIIYYVCFQSRKRL